MHRSVHTPLLPISGAQPFPKWKSRPTGFLHPDVYRISPAEGRPHHSGQARLQSRLQLSSNSTIRPTHSRCSGFISTDRKQVTVARSPSSCMPRQNFTGNSANARCNPLCPAASKICRDFAEISPSESPVGTNTNMSSSGSNAGMNLLPFFTAPKNRSAASLPRSKPFANSPARASGNNFCVAHSAAAAAPGREHPRLISPRCSSAELKYVYGESCLYSRPTAGSRKTPRRILGEVRRQRKISAIGGIHMHAKSEFRPQLQNFWKRIERSCRRRSQRRNHGSNIAARYALRQRVHVHASVRIAVDFFKRQLQHAGDSSMRVVRLVARENHLHWMDLPRNPQRFEIRHRSAAAQMPQKFLPSKHCGNFRNRLLLQFRRRASAIQRVIVWIDVHGQRICQPRHGMRWFQHLSCIERMKIGIVVLQFLRKRDQHFPHALSASRGGRKFRQLRKARVQSLKSAVKNLKRIVIEWHQRRNLLQYLVQLSSGLQQIKLRLLPLKCCIEKRHPFFVFIQPHFLYFLHAYFPFFKSR